jgi:hypothetical protein
MPIWLIEFLTILSMSKRTQWAIILGFLFFIGIHLLGDWVVIHVQLHEQASLLNEVILQKIARQYDKVANITLFSFLILAYKFYRKDKARFW